MYVQPQRRNWDDTRGTKLDLHKQVYMKLSVKFWTFVFRCNAIHLRANYLLETLPVLQCI